MAKTKTAVVRSFFDLPKDETGSMETAEFLADFPSGRKIDWSVLLESDRVLIVSEAGMGKSFECRRTQEFLWEEGHAAFFVELAALPSGPLEAGFSSEEEARFDSWKLAQTEHATFFLDSIDELNLTHSSFERAIKSVAKSLAGHLGRATVVITTRPIPVDREIIAKHLPVPEIESELDPETAFANAAMRVRPKEEKEEDKQPPWRSVALLQLSDEQMRVIAEEAGVADVDRLFEAIRARNAHDFARRPLDFLELCGDWKENGYIRSHRDQVDAAIDVRLRPNKERKERTALEPEKAREGAARLALAALLGRKFNIWHGEGSDRASGDGALNPAKVLSNWTSDEVDTLLERGLFGFANYGRVRFYHRSAIEFLAAERLRRLIDKGLSNRELARLLFVVSPDGDRMVKPALKPMVAWLAPHSAFARQEILKHEPALLLHQGDPESLDAPLRQAALAGYVARYGKGGWRGEPVPSLQVQRFASKELEAEVARVWQTGIENPEVRETLLGLIGASQMSANAELAYGVAVDASAESASRFAAIVALSRIGDTRLPVLLDQIAAGGADWPISIAQRTIVEFFPDQMSAKQVLQILERQAPKRRTFSGPITHFTHVVERADLPNGLLRCLQEQVSGLVSRDVAWEPAICRVRSPRQDLVPALLAVCLRRLNDHQSDEELIADIALALVLAVSDYETRDDATELGAALCHAPEAVRSGVLWAQDRIARRNHPKSERSAQARLYHSQSEGGYQPDPQRDEPWVLAAIADSKKEMEERALALEVAIDWTPRKTNKDEWLDQVCQATIGEPTLVARAEAFRKAYLAPREPQAWEKEAAERKEARRRKHAKGIASWRQFHRELRHNPDLAFSDANVENTLWNFWRAMGGERDDHAQAGWNRGFIERMLSKELADRFQAAFAVAWRRERPTIRSEREEDAKNITQGGWQLGLAGVYAEAEDAAWSAKLSDEEAKLACRYALLELNRLPPWVERLAVRHPGAVDGVIGHELTTELRSGSDPHGMLLQFVRRGAQPVALLLLPRVRDWARVVLRKKRHSDVERRNITNAADFLLVHGSPSDATMLREATIAALNRKVAPKDVNLWLPILGRVDADAFVDNLERLSEPVAPAKASKVVGWLGALFGHHPVLSLSDLHSRPDLLLRLLRLANRHVRSRDDDAIEGVREVGAREHAEYARSSLFNILMEARGLDASRAKLALAEDPEVAHYRDRIIAIRRGKLAEELDSEVLGESEVRELEANLEISPRTLRQMGEVLAGRLDEIDDHLRQDVSPREAWATYNQERLLRRAVAAEFERLARESYTVAQEGITGEEKETDIRLVSKATASIQAVVELKLGENYSIEGFRNALREQLVEKYLGPKQRRVGVLLISWKGSKTWEDPATGEDVAFSDVIRRLNDEAQVLAATLGPDAFLTVRGLNLSTPAFAAKTKPKRTPTKRSASQRRGGRADVADTTTS